MIVALFVFQVPLAHSSMATLRRRCSPSLVRVFPASGGDVFAGDSRLKVVLYGPATRISGCVLTVLNGGFSPSRAALPYPSTGPQGFLLHAVTRLHGPCIISTTRESATLCPLPASALCASFGSVLWPLSGDLGRQSSRASLGKALRPPHIPSACTSVRSSRILGLAFSRLLGPLPDPI